MNSAAVARAFDRAAPTYDKDFTRSAIGAEQRRAFWRYAGELFQPGERVLDLGCGTGEDALALARRGVRVHAIDASAEMIAHADERARREAPEADILFEVLPIERLAELPAAGLAGAYDGTISNFGPLNCLSDLGAAAESLGALIRPGGYAALNWMGRFCLWETVFYPLTACLHRSARRWWAEGVEVKLKDETFRVYYPSARAVTRAFEPYFEVVRLAGIGVLVPPTYLEPYARRFPRLVRLLGKIDRITGAWPGVRALADHRLIVLRRRR